MGTSYNPAAQPDPYIESLANADSESVKNMTSSLYREAPGAALVTKTKPQRENQTKIQAATRAALSRVNDLSFGVGGDVVRGAVNGVNQLGRSIASGINYAAKKLGADTTGPVMEEYRRIQRDGLVTARIADSAMGPDERDSGVHNFIQGAVQFGVANRAFGFLPAGKAGAAKWAGHALRGAAADAFGFDPKADRLSNMLQNAPLGIGRLARALATNPEDGEATARFKAALEGIALSSTIDATVHGIKGLAARGGEAVAAYKGTKVPESGAVRMPQLGEAAAPVSAEAMPSREHVSNTGLGPEEDAAGWASESDGLGDGQPGITHTSEISETGVKRAKFVYRDEAGKPLGVVNYMQGQYGDPALNVVVAPAARRQGIATKLYKYAEAQGFDMELASESGPHTDQGKAFQVGRRAKAGYVVEPFTVKETYTGKHQVIPADEEAARLAKENGAAPEFDTPEQAETVAASLNYAHKNAQRPRMEVTPEQAGYFKTLAGWIHSTGKYEDFQSGTLNIETGERSGGVRDVNFAYDLEPEQVGHLLSSMSAVFRKELDAAKVPVSLMRDPANGSSISHAETVAKAAQDYSGSTPAAATDRFNAISDAVDEAPAAIVAAKVLRQNIAQSVDQLAKMMDANPDNLVAHQQFIKATNTLMHTFVAEKRLLSGSGRALNAGQIVVGAKGAAVNGAELARAMRQRTVNPLDVLHFELIDEPTSEAALKELDHPGVRGDHTPADVSAAEPVTPGEDGSIPAKSKAKVSAEVQSKAGPNTWTLVDEAQAKIAKALEALDKAESEHTVKRVTDKQQLEAAAKDKRAMSKAASELGMTPEDVQLAKDRMRAANHIAAQLQQGDKSNVLASLSADEVGDLASLNVERIKRLADAQRENPLAMPDLGKDGERAPKDKAGTGVNTFTLVDEAKHRIAEAEKRIDKQVFSESELTPEQAAARQDKLASASLPKHDPARVQAAVDWMGGSAEDFKLARERLQAIQQTIAEKRKAAGINAVDWTRYSEVELDDLATMHGERVMKLAEEQRANPMVPRTERTVYMTTRQARALARQMTYVPRDAKEQEQVLRAVLGMGRKATEEAADATPSAWDKVTSYRRWAMLSAPTTPEVNFFSAVSTALYRPMEGVLGGAVRGDKEAVRRYGDLFVGQLKAMHDAMSMAKLSWDRGETVLTARDSAVPNVGEADKTGGLARVMSWLGVNERLMTAGDEFAQQVAYRGHVYAQSLSNARAAGVSDAAEIGARMGEDFERAFTEDGRGTNPAGVSYAQDVTLRRPLEYGIGKLIEDGARDIPAIRVLFPFVRIPVNLARFTMDRAPVVGAFTKRNLSDFAAGGAQRDEAIGRQAAGAMVWSMGAVMAHAGIITGGGPKDPELRRQWLGEYTSPDGTQHVANQPYSVKIGDKWVSYRRFEPLSTPLGIVADFVQMMGELDGEGDVAKAVDGFAAGVASNLTSKAYLKTLSDFFYAVGSGKATATDAFIDGLAGSFIPNAIQRANPDDNLRTTRDFVDRMQSRIPGLSDELEPRRNIYGEKVMKPGSQFQRGFNPFTISDANADPVDVELYRLGEGMSMPVPRKYGVDLQDRSLGMNKQSPYDRWMELMTKPLTDGQPGLRDALRSFVQSDVYKSLTDGTGGYKGSRLLAIEKIVRGYRQAAFAKMVQENPKVLAAIQQEALKKGAALSDDPDVVEALTGHSTDKQLSGHASEAAALLGQQ